MLKTSTYNKYILALFTFAFLFSVIPLHPVKAYAGAHNLYIDPPKVISKTYSKGDIITLSVMGENFTDVYAAQWSLAWNPAVLNLTSHYDAGIPGWIPHIYKGTFLEGPGIITGFLLGPIDYTVGYANMITYGRTGMVSGKTGAGPGLMCTVEFTVVGFGDTKIDLKQCDIIDSSGQSVPGYPKDSPYDGTVKLSEWLHHDVTWDIYSFVVDTESNSSVTDFGFSQPGKMIYFNVTGTTGTTGFCNVTIPKQLLNAAPGNWIVMVGGVSVTPTVTSNDTHSFIYFTYSHSTKMARIIGTDVIPEFPSVIILLTMLTAMLIMLVATRKIPKLKIKQ